MPRRDYNTLKPIEVTDGRDRVMGLIFRVLRLPRQSPEEHRCSQLETTLTALVEPKRAALAEDLAPEEATKLAYLTNASERELWPDTPYIGDGRTFLARDAAPMLDALRNRIFAELEPAVSERFRHGPDYRDCTWNGERYTFTPTQAACVQTLMEERDKGTLEISQQYLLEKAGAESQQLKDVFKGSPAWGKMIVSGSKPGLYKLADPT